MIEFANFLSVLPLYYIIFSTIILVVSIFKNTQIFLHILFYFIGLICALFIPEFIKRLTKHIHPTNLIWYRPKAAKGCDFQSLKGFAEPFTPGFPSGHMTLTTFIMAFNIIMAIEKRVKYKNLIIFINLIFIVLMSWARYYKKCHNIFQIIGGIICGGLLAKATHFFIKKYIKQ